MAPDLPDNGRDDGEWFRALRFGWTQIGPDAFTRTPQAFNHDLSVEQLTDAQILFLQRGDWRFPVIIRGAGEGRTAAALSRNGWGSIDDGASGERIFRPNDATWLAYCDHADVCGFDPLNHSADNLANGDELSAPVLISPFHAEGDKS